MTRTKKQYSGIKKNNKKKKREKTNKINAGLIHIFAFFITGITLATGKLLLLIEGIRIPCEHIMKKAQDILTKVLLKLAQRAVNEALQNMKYNASVSIDGSWTTRRNSLTFILDAIDISTKKIIAFVILDKGTKIRKGNTKEASSLLEAEAFKIMLPKLMKCGKIIKIIKDGDTKLEKLINQSGWNVQIKHDPNHLLKNWPTLFKKYNKLANGTFRGLKPHLQSFLEICLYSNITAAEKVAKFMTSYYHFLGNHSKCQIHGPAYEWKHRNDTRKCQILYNLIKETSKILTDSTPGETTNYNENFHSIKARYVPKAYNLGDSFLGRYCCAILQYNHPNLWIIDVLEHLKFWPKTTTHLITQITTYLTRKAHKLYKQKIIKQSISYKKKKKMKKAQILKEEANVSDNELKHK